MSGYVFLELFPYLIKIGYVFLELFPYLIRIGCLVLKYIVVTSST